MHANSFKKKSLVAKMGHAKEYMNMVTHSSGCNNSELISREDVAIAKKVLTTFCPGEARH